MMRFPTFLRGAVIAAGFMLGLGVANAAEPENTMIIQLKNGVVNVALRPDLAPKHVAQIKALVREGAYNNVAFHRVIDGFMAQTGDVQFGDLEDGFDPGRVGTGGSDKPDLPAEFSSSERFERGTVGMARAQNPNSANSQFFIMFESSPSLDGQYTIVGNVESGMEYIDQIARGDGPNGAVSEPDRMIQVQIGADLNK